MQITKITNNLNFGLIKSAKYIKAEQDLIYSLKSSKQKDEARKIAEQIGKQVPKGYLDIACSSQNGDDTDIIMLRTGSKEEATNREVGTVDKNDPIYSLESLLETLQNFNPKK